MLMDKQHSTDLSSTDGLVLHQESETQTTETWNVSPYLIGPFKDLRQILYHTV